MTEQEAKTKWCPWARSLDWSFDSGRVGGDFEMASGAVNRAAASGEPVGHCIGSACMAWREYETPENKSRAEAEFRKTGARLSLLDGYCGLAGKP